MDPDQVLDDARDALAAGDWFTVAEKFRALDDWLSSGGFRPGNWG